MTVYIVNIILIYMFAAFLLLVKPSEKKKVAYCVVVGLQWTLISGLRGMSVGNDTNQYKYLFEMVQSVPWGTIFNNLKLYITGNTSYVKDPGYPLLEKIFQIFSTNYQAFLMAIAIFFMVTFSVWIYRNSRMPCISYIIYSCLFYSFFSITGLRQTIATAMVVFIGYNLIKKRKLAQFLLLIFVAFFIHKSSICFLPFYFMAYKDITKKYVASFLVITAVIVALGPSFYLPIANAIGYDASSEYGGDTSTFVILICLVVLASFVMFKRIKNNRPDDYKPLYNAMLLTLLLSLLTLREQAFMRVQQYYSLFIMLMIPEILHALKKQVRYIPYIGASAFIIYKMLSRHPGYLFFWQ